MFYFDLFRERDSLCNYTGWEHPEFQKKLTAADLERDPRKRHELLEGAERQLLMEVPAIALFTQNVQYLVKDHLDLSILDLGVYDFKHTKIRM